MKRMQDRLEYASPAPEDDAELMRRTASGDQAAFRLLMQRHLAGAARLAQRVLGSTGAAEDVAQEAFIRVWKHAGNFEAPDARGAKFTTWLYRIVVNLCIDEKRKHRFEALDDIPEPADTRGGAETEMQKREQSARVRKALEDLPERQRTAFVLCFYEEHSNKEAADVMGIGIKAVESLLVRARRTLRDALKTEQEERP
jgi:RNA polymerase sigma-70 factor (ECF subfamily)